jgi:hypothetical protein
MSAGQARGQGDTIGEEERGQGLQQQPAALRSGPGPVRRTGTELQDVSASMPRHSTAQHVIKGEELAQLRKVARRRSCILQVLQRGHEHTHQVLVLAHSNAEKLV